MTEILLNPKISATDFSKIESKTELDLLQPELELVSCDTILGLPKYHLLDNKKTSLTVWLRDSAVGSIHILTLLDPIGYPIKINTINASFYLDIKQPLVKLISTKNGYKLIVD